jgi:hypothetical protein
MSETYASMRPPGFAYAFLCLLVVLSIGAVGVTRAERRATRRRHGRR